MASFHNTSTFYQASTKVLQHIYSESAPFNPLQYPKIFNDYPIEMARKYLQMLSIVGFGTLKAKTEGQSAAIDAASEGQEFMAACTTYALKYIVSEEMNIEDAQKIIPKLPGLLRYSSDQTKEFIAWNIFNFAFNANQLLANGYPLCATNIPVTGNPAVTFTNSLGNTALTVESLMAMYSLFAVMPDDRGQLLTSRTPMSLIYPVGYHQTVVENLSSYFYPSDDSNRVNAIAGTIKPYPIPYLTANFNGPFPWFVLAGKGLPGSNCHESFFSVKWDKQRSWVSQETQALNHETEFRAAWGTVNQRGTGGSQGA